MCKDWIPKQFDTIPESEAEKKTMPTFTDLKLTLT